MAYSIRSVFKGSLIYSIGQIGTKAFGFFLIPIYTRYLTPTDYGIVGYLQVFLQLLATILMFGFYGAQTRFYYEYIDAPNKVKEFLFSINAYLLALLIPLCTILTLWGSQIYVFFNVKEIPFYPFFPIIIWASFFQILNQMVISYSLAKKEYKKCALLQGLQFIFVACLVIVFVVYFKQGALGQLKGILFGQVLFFVIFYFPYTRNFKFRFDLRYLKYALAFGLPIVFHLLAGVLNNSIDRVILAKFVTMGKIGIYTLGYQVGMVMSVIVMSVNKAWQPNYFELMSGDSHDRAFENRRIFSYWLIGIGCVCLIGMLWAEEILIILTPGGYRLAARVIPIIILGFFFQGVYSFAVSPIFQYKKTIILPFLTGLVALINIGFNFLLIPQFGISGAAYATLISFFFQAMLAYILGVKLFNPQFELGKILCLMILLVIVPFVVVSSEISVQSEIIKVTYLVSYIAIAIALFWEYTGPILKKINTRIAIE